MPNVAEHKANYEEIPPSPNDEIFRQKTRELIDAAKTEVVIIGGELSAANFGELRAAISQALARGVLVRVFSNHAHPDLVEELKSKGAEMVEGPRRFKTHYMVVNRRSYIVSEKDEGVPTIQGTRHGRKYPDDTEGAARILDIFEELVRTSGEEILIPTSSLVASGGLAIVAGLGMALTLLYYPGLLAPAAVGGLVLAFSPGLYSLLRSKD